jgi:hypothetical protein
MQGAESMVLSMLIKEPRMQRHACGSVWTWRIATDRDRTLLPRFGNLDPGKKLGIASCTGCRVY